MFFQLVLPVVVTALILGILMIEIQPAGPPLKSSPSEFEVRSELFVTGTGARAPVPEAVVSTAEASKWAEAVATGYSRGTQETPREADLRGSGFGNTSTTLSHYLLDTYDVQVDRLGAYVFNDTIPVNITVDWPRVEPYVDNVLELAVALGFADELETQIFELQPIPVESTTTEVEIEGIEGVLNLTALGQVDDPEDLEELLESVIADRDDDQVSPLLNASGGILLDLASNASVLVDLVEVVVGNTSVNNRTTVQITVPDGELTYTGVDVAEDGSSITLENVQLTANGSDPVDLGNVVLTGDNLALLVPEEEERATVSLQM